MYAVSTLFSKDGTVNQFAPIVVEIKSLRYRKR